LITQFLCRSVTLSISHTLFLPPAHDASVSYECDTKFTKAWFSCTCGHRGRTRDGSTCVLPGVCGASRAPAQQNGVQDIHSVNTHIHVVYVSVCNTHGWSRWCRDNHHDATYIGLLGHVQSVFCHVQRPLLPCTYASFAMCIGLFCHVHRPLLPEYRDDTPGHYRRHTVYKKSPCA
jgi:hypothetical protein